MARRLTEPQPFLQTSIDSELKIAASSNPITVFDSGILHRRTPPPCDQVHRLPTVVFLRSAISHSTTVSMANGSAFSMEAVGSERLLSGAEKNKLCFGRIPALLTRWTQGDRSSQATKWLSLIFVSADTLEENRGMELFHFASIVFINIYDHPARHATSSIKILPYQALNRPRDVGEAKWMIVTISFGNDDPDVAEPVTSFLPRPHDYFASASSSPRFGTIYTLNGRHSRQAPNTPASFGTERIYDSVLDGRRSAVQVLIKRRTLLLLQSVGSDSSRERIYPLVAVGASASLLFISLSLNSSTLFLLRAVVARSGCICREGAREELAGALEVEVPAQSVMDDTRIRTRASMGSRNLSNI
ncbi:hypothetical protein R3P38DRAFT_2811093 [Favolaschia claudopus]|uniref:Uncharacterized protein n=1 Tax=Favolaschia claudopus TaxID=2862362 RepID=A0AAV9ZAM2_9AGAR